MTIALLHTVIVSTIVLSIAVFLTHYFHLKDSPRYRILFLCFVLFGINEVIALAAGAPYYVIHTVFDMIIISVGVIGLAAVEFTLSSIASQFLFHYAILYVALFGISVISLIDPKSHHTLLLICTAMLFVFVTVLLIQEKSRRIMTTLAVIVLWGAAQVSLAYNQAMASTIFVMCLFFILAAIIQVSLINANRKIANENTLLVKFRNVVLDMLNSISSSTEYLTSIDNTLHRILETITTALSVESAGLYIVENPNAQQKVLKYSCSIGLFYPLEPQDDFVLSKPQLIQDSLDKSRFPMGSGVIGMIAESRTPLALDTVNNNHRMGELGIKTHVIRTLMVVPLEIKDELFGVLIVQNLKDKSTVSEHDLRLLQALADQCGVSIGSVRMYQELARTARLRQEANIATQIQKQLLPKTIPELSHLRISAFIEPAKEVGGDYYDFIKHSDDLLGIVIGDVSGKGVPAGMLMVIAKAVIHIVSRFENDTRVIVNNFSKEMYTNMQSGQFMTLNYLIWDNAKRILTFSGAGHEHVLWFHSNSGRCEKIKAGGLASGLVEDPSQFITQQSLTTQKGDVMVLYTDGVTEARNATGEIFTLKRLMLTLESYAYLSDPDKIRDNILKDVREFVDGYEQYDDITLLVLCVG